MKKFLPATLALLTGLFLFAACSDTVADISTSDGGEIVVTESDVGTAEETVNPADGPPDTAEAEYEALTITYTAPDGYTETVDGGGMVTYKLDGYEVGSIVYVPEAVEADVLDAYYDALAYEEEQLREYAAQYAEGLDVDYEVTKQDVNGQQAILVTGTVAEGSSMGTPGDVAYVLAMPMGDQMILVRGLADADTADVIKADLSTFAESINGTPAGSGTSSSV